MRVSRRTRSASRRAASTADTSPQTTSAPEKRSTNTISTSEIMDTPGEYFENKQFYKALIISAVEADVILLLYSVDQEQNTFSPGMNTLFGGKPLIGVITKTDLHADGERLAAIRDILSAAGTSEIVETGIGDGESLDALRCLIEAQPTASGLDIWELCRGCLLW